MRFLVFNIGFLFAWTMVSLQASHIVGGEFELVYTGRDAVYQVRLNMYYDDINAEPSLVESDITITVGVFSKFNNALVRTLVITRQSNTFVNYTLNGCSAPSLIRTRRFRYLGNIDLSGYNSPAGYYIVWERCCRNYVSNNIVHTNVFGNYIEGQVFYLEFPAITNLNRRFINSSPEFGPIPSEYLCLNQPYQVSYAGTDRDGDSLVYSLVSPMRGHTSDLNPILDMPLPAPYDTVIWRSGYGRLNMIPGSPPLRVNKNTGLLTVTPNRLGLYVFGVRVEEFRNGIKIGEVRRDFQYLVYDCPPNYGTLVSVDTTSSASFKSDTLVAPINKRTCFEITASDTNALFYNESESILINTTGISEKLKKTFVISQSTVTITPANPTFKTTMCFDPCNKFEPQQDTLVKFFIVVNDNKCPSKYDTTVFWVKYDLEENNVPPVMNVSLDSDKQLVKVDSLIDFVIYALDPDTSDLFPIELITEDYSLDFYGMEFTQTFMGDDSAAARFRWTPDCDDLEKEKRFRLLFKTKDKSCVSSHAVTKEIILELEDNTTTLPLVQPPNLVTPNGDQKNDCFSIPYLPNDNCQTYFKSINIYNRWGSKVFGSSDRNFQWCPEALSDGVYYYAMDIHTAVVKGWIQVIR
ncbi:MAG: gliding motility-associated C-terminal domain-containing protein [Cytophagaceae bacterium]|nr:gliding motility-associated C-terminal domain-containing protein [Cytophagaceae bacterium]